MQAAKKKMKPKTKIKSSASDEQNLLEAQGGKNLLETAEKSKSDKEETGRKRGWRDIEAIRERARLKELLTDIWHEDIELEDGIFGDLENQDKYYTDVEPVEVIQFDDDTLDDEEEDFDEVEE